MFVVDGLSETKRMMHTLPFTESFTQVWKPLRWDGILQIENNYTVTEFPSKFWWGRLAVAVTT